MSGESAGVCPIPPRLPGFEVTARGALCVRWWQPSPDEGSGVPRAVSQGCSRSFLGWSLHWCQRQPPPFRIQSHGPETPCGITCCSPRCPEPVAGAGPPRCGGATSPHAAAVPPSPLRLAPGAAWQGACSEQPWAETRRLPQGGDFSKPVAPGGWAAKCSGRCHTRQQSSHSAECHTTDGNMQRDTGSVRQTNSPT